MEHEGGIADFNYLKLPDGLYSSKSKVLGINGDVKDYLTKSD